MTAIRVWDGSKWNGNIKWRYGSRWHDWVEGGTSYPVRSDFDTYCDWSLNNESWTPGHVILNSGGGDYNAYDSDYIYAPTMNPYLERDQPYFGRVTAHLAASTGGFPRLTCNLYLDKLWTDSFVAIDFTYVGQTITADTPVHPLSYMDAGWQIYGYAKGQPITFTIYLQYTEVFNSNGTSVPFVTETEYQPHYWNGSSWVEQTTR